MLNYIIRFAKRLTMLVVAIIVWSILCTVVIPVIHWLTTGDSLNDVLEFWVELPQRIFYDY